MIQTNRVGKHYTDNLIDPYLTFDETQTWTVSSGTGSSLTNTEYAFNGLQSLKIENTDPINDIVITNSTQNTLIALKTVTAGLSFYLLKNDASYAYSGEVKIFKNAVLLDTQTFDLANTDDDAWYRFVSDTTYSLVSNDVITFTFQLDGIAGHPGGTSSLYIDGIMLYSADDRLDVMPPKYLMPEDGIGVNQLKGIHGWGNYSDAESSPATQTFTATASLLEIDGGGSSSNSTYLPREIRGISELWDTVNDKITPINIGDSYEVRIDLEVTGETGSPTDIIMQLDIGGSATPTIPIVTRYSSTGKGTPYSVSMGFPIYCLSTFKTNGGQIFISTDTGSVTVASRGIFLSRLSNGNI